MSRTYSQDRMDWLRGQYRTETDLKRLDALAVLMKQEQEKTHSCGCACGECSRSVEAQRYE